MADISVNLGSKSKKIVIITPFSDSDKNIAHYLEDTLNKNLEYDEDIKYEFRDCIKKLIDNY